MAKLARVEVAAKQVKRLTHAYGELIETHFVDQENESPPKEALHYCMVDGGLVLTREDDWKEMKLARVFEAKAHMPESEKRNFIRNSTYAAHLGGCQPFFRKLENTTDCLKNMQAFRPEKSN